MFLSYDTVDNLHSLLLRTDYVYEYDNIIEMLDAQIFLWSLILLYFSTLLFYSDGDEHYYHFLIFCYIFNIFKHYIYSWRAPLQPKSMRTSLLISVIGGHTWTELHFHTHAFQMEERLPLNGLSSQLLSTIICKEQLLHLWKEIKLVIISGKYFLFHIASEMQCPLKPFIMNLLINYFATIVYSLFIMSLTKICLYFY